MTSQIGQDKFVLEMLKDKREGVFVDIGGGHPVRINNTHLLETEYEWSGISVDLGPPSAYYCHGLSLHGYRNLWSQERKTPIICGNALHLDYSDLFKQHSLPATIDYLSVDLHPPSVTYECLLKVPFSEYKFNVITFETDHYAGSATRDPSRKYLQEQGYVLVKSLPPVPSEEYPWGPHEEQDDCYVHKSLS